MQICVVGSSNVDLTFRVKRLPHPGETVGQGALHSGFGGKGANQAVMAARLGARVRFVTRVGKDHFGEAILASYRSEGIDTDFVFVDEQRPTGMAAILVDDEAQNCIIVVPGANQALTPADVWRSANAIRAADVVLTQLEVPVETCVEAFRIAKQAGVRTLLNPAPVFAVPEELLCLTDICIPNETELQTLNGRQTCGLAQVEAAARALLRRGPRSVIVTLGERGALFVDGQTAEHIAAIRVTACDPTGAGDAFIGSLAVFLSEGQSLRDAARAANAAAALSVTRCGAQAAFPARAEVDKFIADLPS